MLSQQYINDFVAIWGKNRSKVGMEGFPCSDRSENSFLEIELSKDLEKMKIQKIRKTWFLQSSSSSRGRKISLSYFTENIGISWNFMKFPESHFWDVGGILFGERDRNFPKKSLFDILGNPNLGTQSFRENHFLRFWEIFLRIPNYVYFFFCI